MPHGRRPAFPAHRDGGLYSEARLPRQSACAARPEIRASPTSGSFPNGRRRRGSSCSGWHLPPQAGAFFFRMARPKASACNDTGRRREVPSTRDIHLHALQEIAVGLVGRGVEGDLDLDPAFRPHDVDALIGRQLGRNGEGEMAAIAEIRQSTGQRSVLNFGSRSKLRSRAGARHRR